MTRLQAHGSWAIGILRPVFARRRETGGFLQRGATPISGPHQSALVDLENREWVFLRFQDAVPYGRIVHMQPVFWDEDWPLMGVDHFPFQPQESAI
jgi:beta-xylosidase